MTVVPAKKFQEPNSPPKADAPLAHKFQQEGIARLFDLEERTVRFAERCRNFVLQLPKNIPNAEYGKQLIRAAASPAANYIEANESLGTKDFVHKMKICRKEAKESRLWLRLCIVHADQESERRTLIAEATELVKIFNAIVRGKEMGDV